MKHLLLHKMAPLGVLLALLTACFGSGDDVPGVEGDPLPPASSSSNDPEVPGVEPMPTRVPDTNPEVPGVEPVPTRVPDTAASSVDFSVQRSLAAGAIEEEISLSIEGIGQIEMHASEANPSAKVTSSAPVGSADWSGTMTITLGTGEERQFDGAGVIAINSGETFELSVNDGSIALNEL